MDERRLIVWVNLGLNVVEIALNWVSVFDWVGVICEDLLVICYKMSGGVGLGFTFVEIVD